MNANQNRKWQSGPVGLVDQSLEGHLLLEGVVILQPLQGGELSQTLRRRKQTFSLNHRCGLQNNVHGLEYSLTSRARKNKLEKDYISCPDVYLQDDVIESNEILRTRPPLVLVHLGLLQFALQSVSHAFVPLHQRAQLDVGQVTETEEQPGSDKTCKKRK